MDQPGGGGDVLLRPGDRRGVVAGPARGLRLELGLPALHGLQDLRARACTQAGIERLAAAGHAGDVQPVSEGVSELRIDYGLGYRVYFRKRARTLIILLAGGNRDCAASLCSVPAGHPQRSSTRPLDGAIPIAYVIAYATEVHR